ncbi:MAG: hypothetical protein ABH872_00675 [Candidatus Omnitrophota bacterium]
MKLKVKSQMALIYLFAIAFVIALIFTAVDRARKSFSEYTEKKEEKDKLMHDNMTNTTRNR